MLSYKIVFVVVALAFAGGAGSSLAVNAFFPGANDCAAAVNDLEVTKRAQRQALYCEHYKGSNPPFPGCE